MRGLVAFFAFIIVVLCGSSAFADPIRILIAASHHDGRSGEQRLRHADADATKVRDVFVRLGGVAPARAIVLAEPTADELLTAVDHAVALAGGRPAQDVAILFYFSGHGDHEAIHLGAETLPIATIEAHLPPASAALRIVVLDACRTNDGRPKGFTDAQPFAIDVPQRESAEGLVRIQATADGEVAQESDELAGAVFTHYWVSGLSGAADVNDDGRVTLDESYAYAYQQTLWRSATSAGVPQRPAAVLDVHEGAPLVLTNTARASALRFPLAADTHFLVYGLGSRTVVGDLWGAPDRRVVLAVAPGRYMIHRRGGGESGAAEAEVVADQQHDLRTTDFRSIPEDQLSNKGGDIVLYPDELAVAYALRSIARLVDRGHELDLTYTRGLGAWAFVGGLQGGLGARATSTHDARLTWAGGRLGVERRQALGPLTLRLGFGGVIEYFAQKLTRTDAPSLVGAGYAIEQSFSGPAAGGRISIALRIPVGSRVWIDVGADGDLLATSIEESLAAVAALGALAGIGASF